MSSLDACFPDSAARSTSRTSPGAIDMRPIPRAMIAAAKGSTINNTIHAAPSLPSLLRLMCLFCFLLVFLFTVSLPHNQNSPAPCEARLHKSNLSTQKSALSNDHLRILLRPQTLFMGFRLQEDVSDFGVGHLGIYTVEASERSGE